MDQKDSLKNFTQKKVLKRQYLKLKTISNLMLKFITGNLYLTTIFLQRDLTIV